METKPEKSNKTVKKVLNIVGNVFIWLFIAFAVLMTILAFAAQSSPDGIPSIGKNVIFKVETDSMSPTIEAGDMIISKKLSDSEKFNLGEKEVISFLIDDVNGDQRKDLNTHRIIEVKYDEDGKVTAYITQGDNHEGNVYGVMETVSPEDVYCKWEGTRLKGMGNVLAWLQSSTGFLVTIVIPLVLFFILEIILFIRKVNQVRGAGKKQISAADEELIKQKAIEEYLKQQEEAKKAESEAAAPEENVPAPEEEKKD